MSEHMILRAVLKGHNNWVTQIATTSADPDIIVSASRDKTLIKWRLKREEGCYGVMERALKGHSHFVSDAVISSDGQFALSASWDQTLRLWDLKSGQSTVRFVGHTKDVTSVAFSADNRQIVSASRDKTIRLWNTRGECKYTVRDDGSGHTEWVSCVRFSPNTASPVMVSCGWDRAVKVWSLANCKLKTNHLGHTGYLNAVSVSPEGSLCASGGKDGHAMLWDLKEGKHLYTLEAGQEIHALCFSPTRYWLCAAAGPYVRIWDLEGKVVVMELKPEVPAAAGTAVAGAGGGGGVAVTKAPPPPLCISLAWSADGQTLFTGHTDNVIKVWQFTAGMQ